MKTKAVLLLLLVTLTGRALPGRGLELSLSYGRWSSFPFATLVERQCGKMVDYEINKLLGWVSPLLVLRTDERSIDFSSGGHAIHSALTYHFPSSRFAVSLEASWLRLDLPYTLEFRQSVELFGYPIAQAHTIASGTARVRSLDASLWVQWRLWQMKKVSCSLAAGLHVMPLKGDVDLRGHASLKTIAGPEELDLADRQTMAELRGGGQDIPRALVFPALAFSAGYSLSRSLGVLARLALSQGVFLSVGLTVGL